MLRTQFYLFYKDDNCLHELCHPFQNPGSTPAYTQTCILNSRPLSPPHDYMPHAKGFGYYTYLIIKCSILKGFAEIYPRKSHVYGELEIYLKY